MNRNSYDKLYNKTHNWTYRDKSWGTYGWKCSDCGIDDSDPLSRQRCLKFNILVHVARKIIQFEKGVFHKAGMFLLRFSR